MTFSENIHKLIATWSRDMNISAWIHCNNIEIIADDNSPIRSNMFIYIYGVPNDNS
jgi:hypothetical protein